MRTGYTVVICLLALAIAFPIRADAQSDNPNQELVSNLRLRKSDPTSLLRFAKFAGGAVGIALALYLGHRMVLKHWPQQKTRRLTGWQRTLQGYGLNAAEREVIAKLGRSSDLDPVQIVTDRHAFESAVDQGSELSHADSRSEKTIMEIRRKLGWDQTATAASLLPDVSAQRNVVADALELNQEVELFGVGEGAGFCARGILVHRDDQNLVFRFLEGKDEIPFGPNDRLQIYFWRSNDAGYLCQTQVKEIRAKGPGFLITMLPDAIERQQKRIYVRVPYAEQIRYLHIPLSSASELFGSETRSGGVFDGVCLDLSAGGFRLRTDVELHPGDYLSIPHFQAANDEEVMARVVGTLEVGEDGQGHYGVQFTGIPANMRDTISKLVFQLQRRMIVEKRREAELAEASTAGNAQGLTPPA